MEYEDRGPWEARFGTWIAPNPDLMIAIIPLGKMYFAWTQEFQDQLGNDSERFNNVLDGIRKEYLAYIETATANMRN
jgi:hypothetical protein